jgi:hypothetical protein
MWVFKKKINADGTLRYKAQLVIKGCQQRAGIDYSETYASVAMLKTVRILLALAAHHEWHTAHLDVITAFLNSTLKEVVYMALPEGLEGLEGAEGACVLLQKALYSLKQAPRAWYSDINRYLQSIGLKNSKTDLNLYIGPDALLLLYVDDMLIFAKSTTALKALKKQLMEQYNMHDLGEARQFLGLQITRTG